MALREERGGGNCPEYKKLKDGKYMTYLNSIALFLNAIPKSVEKKNLMSVVSWLLIYRLINVLNLSECKFMKNWLVHNFTEFQK